MLPQLAWALRVPAWACAQPPRRPTKPQPQLQTATACISRVGEWVCLSTATAAPHHTTVGAIVNAGGQRGQLHTAYRTQQGCAPLDLPLLLLVMSGRQVLLSCCMRPANCCVLLCGPRPSCPAASSTPSAHLERMQCMAGAAGPSRRRCWRHADLRAHDFARCIQLQRVLRGAEGGCQAGSLDGCQHRQLVWQGHPPEVQTAQTMREGAAEGGGGVWVCPATQRCQP